MQRLSQFLTGEWQGPHIEAQEHTVEKLFLFPVTYDNRTNRLILIPENVLSKARFETHGF